MYELYIYVYNEDKRKYASIKVNQNVFREEMEEAAKRIFWGFSDLKPGKTVYDCFDHNCGSRDKVLEKFFSFKGREFTREEFWKLEEHDIVHRAIKGTGGWLYHAGIYVGGLEVVHISKEEGGIGRIKRDSLSVFLGPEEKILVTRLIIPFLSKQFVNKKLGDLVGNIWKYNIDSQNCEHFVTESFSFFPMNINHIFIKLIKKFQLILY